MKFGNNIDLDYNEIQKVRLFNLSSEDDAAVVGAAAVSNNNKGYIYFDTHILKPRYWDGNQWRTIIDDRAKGISNTLLANSSITIAGTEVSLGDSIAANTITGAATKLGTADKGTANRPIYLSAGVPTAITSLSVAYGGTGKTSIAANSMLYASAANTLGEVTTSQFGRGLLNASSGTMVSGLVAESATKLTTTSKNVWGQTYWTSGGVPDNVSGDMSSVGKITFSTKGSVVSSNGNVLEVVTIGGVNVLHSCMPFYSDSWVASGGIGDAGGGSGGGHNLKRWSDLPNYYSSETPTSDQESADVASAWAVKNVLSIANTSKDLLNSMVTGGKINSSYLPDYLLGQMVYGGTFNPSTKVATLSTAAKDRLGTSSNTITLTDNQAATTGYKANEGIYYIAATTSGTFAGENFNIGDWLVSTGAGWKKIDNTDAVSSVTASGNISASIANGVLQIGVASNFQIPQAAWITSTTTAIDSIVSLSNAIAENRQRIKDIEAWKASPYVNGAYVRDLGVERINLDGLDIWRDGNVANVGGDIKAKGTTTSDVSVKAENSSGQIGIVASNGIRGLYNVTGTSGWVVATNGTNTRLSHGNVAIGDSFNTDYKLYVNGTVGVNDVLRLTGALSVTAGQSKRMIRFGDNSYLELIDLGSGNSPRYALHSNVPFYSDSWIASGGIGTGGSSGGGGLVETIHKYSELGGSFSDSANDTFNAYSINYIYGKANTALQSIPASTTDSNPSYVLTSISKSGTAVASTRAAIYHNKVSLNGSATSVVTASNTAVSFYAPTTAGTSGYFLKSNGNGAPTWGAVDFLDKSSAASSLAANTMLDKAGLRMRMVNTTSGGYPTSYGSIVEWTRSVDVSGTVSDLAQFYVPHKDTKLYFRHSWGETAGQSPSGDEWKPWLEVATIGTGGSVKTSLVHTYTVKRSLSDASTRWNSTNSTTGYTIYTTAHTYDNSDLIAALYDDNNNLIMTDIQIHLYEGQTASAIGKYGVRLSFAKPFPTNVEYKLVVYGLSDS